MDKTIVNLMRHGEVYNPNGILYGRLPDFHLSSRGEKQAYEAGEFLKDKKITFLMSSPLERAQETIAIAGKNFKKKPVMNDLLIEAGNDFEGQRINQKSLLTTPKHWKKLLNPYKPSWGESYSEIAKRMLEVVKNSAKENLGTESLLVSHQLPIYTLRRKILQQTPWHDPRKRECALASVHRIFFEDDKIIGLNYWEPGFDEEKIVWQK